MGKVYRYLATADEASCVLNWFRTLNESPVESPHSSGSLFYFRQLGPLMADESKSPLVNVFVPQRRRGALTTVGEVHFLATPISAIAGMNAVNQQFRKWVSGHPCVYSHRESCSHHWDYFLEGSSKNCDSDIFALPSGMAALQAGSYFVSSNDNDTVLDRVCRTLELRDVKGLDQ